MSFWLYVNVDYKAIVIKIRHAVLKIFEQLCKIFEQLFQFWATFKQLFDIFLSNFLAFSEQNLERPISGKLPTYPSPKLTLTLTSHLGKNDGLGEGWVGSFPETLIDPTFGHRRGS